MTTATRTARTTKPAATKPSAPLHLAAEHNGVATGRAIKDFGVNAHDTAELGVKAAASFVSGFWSGLTGK